MFINNQQKNNSGFTPTPSLVSGFTLIELMVATSLFVVIMLSSMSALFMLLGESKNSRALRFAMDNVNFAMDSMTRSIRMGSNYYCVDTGSNIPNLDTIESSGQNCTNGGPLLAFIPQLKEGELNDGLVAYMRAETTTDKYTIQKCTTEYVDSCVPIVSPDVNIDVLKFFVDGTLDSDKKQPSVYIIMKGTVMVKGVPISFAVQTLASQRNFK